MKTLAITAFAAMALLVACDRRENDGNSTVGEAPDAAPQAATAAETPAPAAAPGEQANSGDVQALSLLAAINQHEIDAARQAVAKGVKGAVAEYAAMMEKDHGENQAKTLQMITPVDTPDVASMKADGAKELQALDQQSSSAYEKAYIKAMVAGHQKALTAIDEKMLPAAQSDPAKTHLTQTRVHVAHHLERAKAIEATQG
ncbi:MAG TPA: DUF4142 domain-containing protein [Lysobacter sp.]